MKLIITILLSTAALIVSQWLNHVWLLKEINTSNQSIINQLILSSQTQEKVSTPITFPKKNTITESNINPIDTVQFEKKITLLIHKEINKALKNNFEKNELHSPTKNSTHQTEIESQESKEAYYSSLDIVSEAQSYGLWDESVNIKLSPYKDKMTQEQKNLIVEQYVKAFSEGLISPNVSPPF